MDLTALLDDSLAIDITGDVVTKEKTLFNSVATKFETVVQEISNILLHERKPVCVIKLSHGKDSSTVSNCTFEAYRRLIAKGAIESSRPLIIISGDTKVEQHPMVMYPNFDADNIKVYCEINNINLYYIKSEPGLKDEFFVKYGGANKLLSNATRSGDCTPILKTDPANKALKTILGSTEAPLISLVGSRRNEGSRRTANMDKQGILHKSATDLLDEVSTMEIGTITDFAPIRDWCFDEVFGYLRIAGTEPIEQSEHTLPFHMPHAGLLLEIYGNGSGAEVCELALGANQQSAACGGKARFGCTVCTQVPNDKSSEGLNQLERWRALGSENALRVRDWLFRVSCSIDARAYHAKSIDPVFNRIMLQPNVLKTRYLEKMVRYAAQLTLDSHRAAEEFSALVDQGLEHTHPGYAEILADTSMTENTKKLFLRMYKQEAQKPLMNYFNTKHAILLSFQWALDGVGALPYRPLAILRDVMMYNKRIPYPKLNSEMPYAVTLKSEPVPEAFVLRMYKEEYEQKEYLNDDLAELYSPSFSAADHIVMAQDMHCGTTDRAHHNAAIRVNADIKMDRFGNLTHTVNKVAFRKGAKLLTIRAKERYIKALEEPINRRFNDAIFFNHLTSERNSLLAKLADRSLSDNETNKGLQDLNNFVQKVLDTTKFQKPSGEEFVIPHLELPLISAGVKPTKRTIDDVTNATFRRRSKTKGKLVASTTRLRFYKPNLKSKLERAHEEQIIAPRINMSQFTDFNINIANSECTTLNEESNINFDGYDFITAWGGDMTDMCEISFMLREIPCSLLYRVLDIHDSTLKNCIKSRLPVRHYCGTDNEAVINLLFAEGSLSILPHYAANFKAARARTNILSQRGAFLYQNMSSEKLKKEPGIKTMKEHRSEKAEYLLRVRAIRNDSRRSTRELLTNPNSDSHLDTITNRIEIIFNNLTEAAQYIQHNDMYFSSYGHWNSHDKAASKLGLLLLETFKSEICSFNDFKRTFLRRHECTYLDQNYSALISVEQSYCDAQKALTAWFDTHTLSEINFMKGLPSEKEIQAEKESRIKKIPKETQSDALLSLLF
ncbi:hypothetical protein AB4254_13630 [Vibrio breoganii]